MPPLKTYTFTHTSLDIQVIIMHYNEEDAHARLIKTVKEAQSFELTRIH